MIAYRESRKKYIGKNVGFYVEVMDHRKAKEKNAEGQEKEEPKKGNTYHEPLSKQQSNITYIVAYWHQRHFVINKNHVI